MSTATLAIPGSILRGNPGHRRRRHCDRCDIAMGHRTGTLCTPCIWGVADANPARFEAVMERLKPAHTHNGRTHWANLKAQAADEMWHG